MATSALSALLELSPTDPADVHYRLAMAQHSLGQHDLAKRSVLKALEEAPRYRDALDLLVAIVQTQKAKEPE
jgi:Tfp pilus assembly protein PilF